MAVILIEQCRSIDIMWMKTGIDQAELEDAIIEHKLPEDPEFRKKMESYINEISAKAMQAEKQPQPAQVA